MNKVVNIILTMILLVLGALIVFTNPIDPLAIIVGMFLISVSILILAIQVYFPPTTEEPVELKIVEEPKTVKIPVKVEKPRKTTKVKKKR
jgi:uncharacterized membrane protein YfcA